MGWLRDLMQTAEPPFASFGTLARTALAHRAWPAAVRAQPRSLATIFSKLDRDVDLQWLQDRTDVQRVLAELLGCSVADIQASAAAGETPADDAARRIRLDDLRFARALDLVSEPLPPGIPDAVLHPETWGRLWWVAPAGSGRSLTGRWLAARGLARFVADPEPSGVVAALGTQAAVFVELTEPIALPARDRICVAAPFAPPPDEPWTVVRSPPVADFLPALVEWVGERLESDDAFDAESAVRWLGSGPLARGEIDSLGTALGLCGLFDELGARSLRDRNLADAARRYVELRMAEWRRNESGDTTGIERRAFDVLIAMLVRVLTDDERPWHAARSFDEWIDLVPPEHRHGADVAWLRLSLPEVDRTIRAADIERAAQRLPPGAHRIVRALRGARLLVARGGDDRLALSPRWLGRVVARQAEHRLVESSAFELGEALLRPHAAAGVATALDERIQQGDTSLVEALLELEDDDNPAYVAALEHAFVAVGLSVLGGSEISAELAAELLSEQMRLAIVLDERGPLPRVLEARRRDAWHVAGLALSELGGEKHVLAQDHDAALRFYRSAPRELAAAVSALIDRTLRARGDQSGHRIALASVIVGEALAGSVAYEHLRALDDPERDARSLMAIAAQRNLSREHLARAIWQSVSRAAAPSLPPLLTSAAARELYAELPVELVPSVLERAARADALPPIEAFGAAQWTAFVDTAARLELGLQEAAIWSKLPREHAQTALDRPSLPSRPALEVLWHRFPDALVTAHAAALSEPNHARAVELLRAAPDPHAAALIQEFRRRAPLDRVPDPALSMLRSTLHEHVTTRRSCFRDAYALLAEAEHLLSSSGV